MTRIPNTYNPEEVRRAIQQLDKRVVDETDPVFVAWQTAYDHHANWDTAYGWGDHSTEGYLTVETDPVFLASVSYSITQGDIDNWNSAGDGLTYDADLLCMLSDGTGGGGGDDPRISDGDIINWDTAYGWGDHSVAGYLTTETEPEFNASVAHDITQDDVDTWNAGGAVIDPAYSSTVNTTGTTPTLLVSIPITQGSVTVIEIRTFCVYVNDTSKGAGIIQQFVYHNTAGTATIIGAVNNDVVIRSAVGLSTSIAANGANVEVKVIGISATSINWGCIYRKSVIS